jgi:hypothetical protein
MENKINKYAELIGENFTSLKESQELSLKQKKIAKLAGDPNKLDSADFAALRAGKHVEEADQKCTTKETKKVAEDYVSHAQRKAVWASRNEKKKIKEETEQIDEISAETHKSYQSAVKKELPKLASHAQSGEYKDFAQKLYDKRMKGLTRSSALQMRDKMANEEVEQVQEGEPAYYKGKSTTGNALPDPGSFADRKRTGNTFLKGFKSNPQPIKPCVVPKNKNKEVELDEKAPVAPVPGQKMKDHAIMVHSKTNQRVTIPRKNIGNYPSEEGWKEVSPGVKEETELTEMINVNKRNYSWGKMITVHHGKSHSYPLHPEHQEAIAKLKDGEKTSFTDETNTKVNAYRDGDTIHLSQKNIAKSSPVPRSHFVNEETELNELDKSTMRSYVNKAAVDLARSGNTLGRLQVKNNNKPSTGSGIMSKHIDKRLKGIDTATKKLAYEEVEQNGTISFSQFMEWLEEGKIDDMRDRMAVKRASMHGWDPDYKPAEKAKSSSQMVKGAHYGGSLQHDDHEGEEGTKPTKPTEPEVKRGRGRPKGSKSGARH